MHFQNFDALSKFRCTFRISMHFEHFEHLGLRRLCARLHRLSARLRSSGGNVFFKCIFLKCFYPKCISAKCTRLACLLSFASLLHLGTMLTQILPECINFVDQNAVPQFFSGKGAGCYIEEENLAENIREELTGP